jgi:hypothetical protein
MILVKDLHQIKDGFLIILNSACDYINAVLLPNSPKQFNTPCLLIQYYSLKD